MSTFEQRDARPGQTTEHRGRHRAGPGPEVEHVGGRWRKRRKQLDAGGEHVVVVGNEAPDLDVVLVGVDLEMALDRVGDAAILNRELRRAGQDVRA